MKGFRFIFYWTRSPEIGKLGKAVQIEEIKNLVKDFDDQIKL